jgi:hypothetical protein
VRQQSETLTFKNEYLDCHFSSARFYESAVDEFRLKNIFNLFDSNKIKANGS